MKKIIFIVAILVIALNMVMIFSSITKTPEVKKERKVAAAIRLEFKNMNPLFIPNLLKF